MSDESNLDFPKDVDLEFRVKLLRVEELDSIPDLKQPAVAIYELQLLDSEKQPEDWPEDAPWAIKGLEFPVIMAKGLPITADAVGNALRTRVRRDVLEMMSIGLQVTAKG